MPKFDCFIFDIDGTIVNTGKLIFESFRHVAEKYLGKSFTDEEIIAFFGPTEETILRQLMGADFPAAERDYFDFYSESHKKFACLHNGILENLKTIKSAKIPMAVFTGKGRRSAIITLEQIGIREYFDLIITGDEVKNHKPHHEGLELIVQHFGVARGKTILIGDSSADIRAANAARIKCAAVRWDDYAQDGLNDLKSDFTFHRVKDLQNFIAESIYAE